MRIVEVHSAAPLAVSSARVGSVGKSMIFPCREGHAALMRTLAGPGLPPTRCSRVTARVTHTIGRGGAHRTKPTGRVSSATSATPGRKPKVVRPGLSRSLSRPERSRGQAPKGERNYPVNGQFVAASPAPRRPKGQNAHPQLATLAVPYAEVPVVPVSAAAGTAPNLLDRPAIDALNV
jgi:hypothetical protein